jgi:rhodanese-related sulfurtransferase
VAEIVAIRDEGLGNSSYLVDLGDSRGLVLDPSRDPGPHLAAARRRGLRLTYTAETHLHADFVSGSRELATSGAVVVAPAAAALQFPHRGLGDGDEVDLGGLSLRALATPGHTPEHLAWLLADGARPLALFSGGSLLVGELDGGMAAWRAAGLPVARIEIAEVVDQPSGTVLDVRQQGEFASGHLPGARHVELGALASAGELPGGPLAVMCGHGERAMTGASLLQRAGRGDLTVLVGGPSEWSRATRRPLERS